MKAFVFFVLCSFQIVVAQNDNCACCTENHSAFDFWVGEWVVTTPDGNKAGENSIVKLQDNCVLQENWTSAKGNFTGTSHNFYNAKTGQWEQLWIDNQGQSLHMKGNRVDNKMIMKTETQTDAEGNTIYNRITWFKNDDGTVRQLWETITNDDKITIAFDGLYKRK